MDTANFLDDVTRSLKRHFALALPDYEITLQQDEISDQLRPLATIIPNTPVTFDPHRTSIPTGFIDARRSYTLTAYPAIGETSNESRAAAEDAAAVIALTLTMGIVDDDDEYIGGPLRIPLYDYSDVLYDGDPEERKGPDEPYGYIWVDRHNTNTIPDLADDRRYTVACDMALSWRIAGRIAKPAEIVSDLPGTFTP